MKKLLLSLCIFSLISLFASAQPKPNLESIVQKHVKNYYADLYDFMVLPSNAHIKEQIQPNLDWLKKAFEKRGFSTEALPTGGHPVFFAEKKPATPTSGPLKTLLFYMHFDGQPVEPEKWQQESPYKPVLKKRGANGQWEKIDWNNLQTGYDPEWRIFARAVSDDKGPILMLLAALDMMQKESINSPYHIKVILDSEEEIGAPHLAEAVKKYKEKLAADFLMVMDGGRHLSNEPTLTYGCRGIATITLTTYGPKTPQHSGHYGNYAPNPALRMAQLLASMKDEDGRVTIPGYYDGISIDADARKILAAVPDSPENIRQKLGFAAPDKVGANYQEALQYPSLNIRGLVCANIGEKANTIVPEEAIAEIDLRLVPETDPDRLVSLIKKHIEGKGYVILNRKPTDEERLKYPKIVTLTERESRMLPFRTDFGIYPDRWLTAAMMRTFGKEPIKIRMTGGSVPIVPFLRELNLPAIHVPMVNMDNNQHAANENLRLGNYVEGIKTWMAILTQEQVK
ncbi:M20/M25/M40 family metallo-hydrolase [Runella salmonicolor]|uniref:M20/M25/M40 family metallo-hydrolase n=1 Tax=Runella salmonicolor TaxID=2950278 RepID=A0ABT1FVC8_9BACT|nr:M20/M25/M40 family metallo-hydrolase [Runella salmonicolor]MCP1385718.1 M20/M25/M40 family metallo-hydrolase [Runella salmonicolor]